MLVRCLNRGRVSAQGVVLCVLDCDCVVIIHVAENRHWARDTRLYEQLNTDLGTPINTALCPGSVGIRDGNRSPKISDLRKCPNPIRTSVGHPIFSWTIFGRAISLTNSTHFSTLWVYGTQVSEDNAMRVSFCASVTIREHLPCREQFMCAMCKDNQTFWSFLDIFG